MHTYFQVSAVISCDVNHTTNANYTLKLRVGIVPSVTDPGDVDRQTAPSTPYQ
jgi:hypothetical protein